MWGFYAKPAGAAGRYPSRERQLPPVPHPPGAHQEGLIEGFSERPVEPCCSGLRRQPGRRAARCVGMHINKRGRLTGLALLGAAASVLTVGCFTASAAPIPAPSLAGTVTVALPVVHCPTTFGAPPARRVSLPATRQVAVPRAMAARLSVYADTQGYMYLVCGGLAAGQYLHCVGGGRAGKLRVLRLHPCPGLPAVPGRGGHPGKQRLPALPSPALRGAGKTDWLRHRTLRRPALETCTLPAGDSAECAAIVSNYTSWYGSRL
jgi:hypothetical protein